MPKPQLKEILNDAAKLLAEKGVDSARIDARILLEHALGFTREQLISKSDYVPNASEIERFNTLIKRRVEREPVAKIIGKKEFWGMDFKTSKYTLDPRPDSETLIEAVLKYFSKHKNSSPLEGEVWVGGNSLTPPSSSLPQGEGEELKILDLGTGTGCLLLALMKEYKNANGVGVDISEDALKVAKENAKNLGLQSRTKFIQSNWDKNISGEFDIIISNPPYIKSEEIKTLEKDVSEFDPMLALDGGNSGLEAYEKIIPAAKKLLKKNGMIFLEIGQGQEKELKEIIERNGLEIFDTKKDLAGILRCIVVG